MNRISTGIAGLDLVLNGGLEHGAVVAVAGPPGAGKTILAQQICFANATAGRKCVYYTTVSEPHAKLVRHLEPFAFFDPAALGPRVEHIHLGDFLRPDAEGGPQRMVAEIVRKAQDDRPAVVVVDSAKMLRDFSSERELRTALYALIGQISPTGTVLLLLGEYRPEELQGSIEFSLADGIIQLQYEVRQPADRRWLQVVKMRGGRHSSGRHTFRIGDSGIEVFPRLEAIAAAAMGAPAGRVRSGIPGLDELMGGGMQRGDASLVMGPPGVGKTTFGLGWLAEGLGQGERCLCVTFRETAGQLAGMAAAFGWDLEGALARGQLVASYVPMDDLDLDVLASGIRTELAGQPVSRVLAGGLAEMVFASRDWERLPAYLRSLTSHIRAAGASLLATSETAPYGFGPQSLDSLMYLFDNVIRLRYIAEGSRVSRAIQVTKMRTSRHEMTPSSFTISDRGVVVGDRLEGASGLLGLGLPPRQYQPDLMETRP